MTDVDSLGELWPGLTHELGGATVVLLVALPILAAFMVWHRNNRLLASAAAARTRASGNRELAAVLWECQQVGALGKADHVQLARARSAAEVEQVLQRAHGSGDVSRRRRELAVAIARAEEVEDSARLVSRGVSAAVPAVDVLLSNIDQLVPLLPGAVLGLAKTHDLLDRMGLDVAGTATALLDGYADHVGDTHVPLLTLIATARRETQMVGAGKPVSRALQHATLDVAAASGGAFVGLKAGMLAGSLVAPGIGTAIGAILGAVAGGQAGKTAAFAVKSRPFVAASEELAAATLAAMPVDAATITRHLRGVAEAPYQQTVRQAASWSALTRKPGLFRWPTFGEVLHEVSLTHSKRAVAESESLHRRATVALTSAGSTRVGPAGAALVLVNCPVEAAALGVNSSVAETLAPLQRRVSKLRSELIPAS